MKILVPIILLNYQREILLAHRSLLYIYPFPHPQGRVFLIGQIPQKNKKKKKKPFLFARER